jgi:hypothetical protein
VISLSPATRAAINNRDYLFVALAVTWLLWQLIARARSRPPQPRDYYTLSTNVLAWAVVLHFLDTLLFLQWGVFAWHFVLYPLFVVIMMAGVVEGALRSSALHNRAWLYWGTIAILLMVSGRKELARNSAPLDHFWHVASYTAALWAREHTPADTIFAMRDAGHFAFFSERRVINLDGLVNDMAFQRVIAERRVGQYLHENHVQYLVLHALPGREDVVRGDYDSVALNYVSHKFGVVSDDVIVRPRDEVYRSPPYFDGPNHVVCLIWALGGDKIPAAAAGASPSTALRR